MRNVTLCMAVLVAAGTLGGCGDEQESTVGVVDLVKVARGIGELNRIEDQQKADQATLNQQLNQIKQNLVADVAKFEEEIGATPTEEQKQQLLAKKVQADRLMRSKIMEARQLVAVRKQNELNALREKLRPVAAAVGQRRGITIILMSPSCVWSDSSVDLTDAVTIEANEQRKSGLFKATTQPAE